VKELIKKCEQVDMETYSISLEDITKLKGESYLWLRSNLYVFFDAGYKLLLTNKDKQVTVWLGHDGYYAILRRPNRQDQHSQFKALSSLLKGFV